jgi:hypothetical protein
MCLKFCYKVFKQTLLIVMFFYLILLNLMLFYLYENGFKIRVKHKKGLFLLSDTSGKTSSTNELAGRRRRKQ